MGLSGGAEVLLGWRLLTVLIGLVGLGFYLRGGRRFVHLAAEAEADGSNPNDAQSTTDGAAGSFRRQPSRTPA